MASPALLPPAVGRDGLGRKRKASSDDDYMMTMAAPAAGGSNSPSAYSLSDALLAHPDHLYNRTVMKRAKLSPTPSVDDQQQQHPPQEQPQQRAMLPISKVLDTMGKNELLEVILTLIDRHPGLDRAVAALLPRPTIPSAVAHIQQLQERLDASFPFNRWGPDRTDYAYNRVRPHLQELTELILNYLNHFTEPSTYPSHLTHDYPTTAFAFAHHASRLAGALPVWSSERHNASSRDELLKHVATAWRVAIAEIARRVREEGRMFPASLVGEWARNLAEDTNNVKGAFGFAEALEEFQVYLGWIIGVGPSQSNSGTQGNFPSVDSENRGNITRGFDISMEHDLKPGEVNLGTTIMAVQYKDGVIVGADSRTTTGSYIANRVTDKLTPIHDRIFCCRSGSAADTQAVADIVSYYIQQFAMTESEPPQVHIAATLFQELCYSNKDNLSAGIIVAGWDKYNGPSVYSIPLGGSLHRQPFAIGGSGSTYIYGFCDAAYREGFSREEAIDFTKKAIALAMSRDGSSGGVIRLAVITEKGVERIFTPGNGLPKFWEG